MQTMKINKKIIIKVILLGAILTTFAVLAMYAYAKYMTSVRGKAHEEIAKWRFDVTTNGVPISSEIIDFATTRDINDTDSVARGTIAPGTFGVFELIVNTEGTETLAEYNIKIDLVDCPTNLKFYFDSGYTQEIKKERINEIEQGNETISTDELNIYRYIPLNEHKEYTERIYWEWPLQTGNTPQDIYKNDLEDSKWLAKEKMIMTIAAIGEQVLEEPIYFVNYNEVYTTKGFYTNFTAATPRGSSRWIHENGEDIWLCDIEENTVLTGTFGPYITGIVGTLIPGERYRLSIEAKCSRDLTTNLRFEPIMTSKKIELTTKYKSFYIDFYFNRVSEMNALTFYTPNWTNGDELHIKNININKIVTNGSQYGPLYTPTREGYVFEGWYTEEEGGIQITENSRVNLMEDITLYAHWKEEIEE